MMPFLRPLVLICLVALLLTGCGQRGGWQQRITLHLTTPDGPMQASSVVRVAYGITNSPFLPGEARGVIGSHRGEAVVADLGEGRYLFALLKGRNDLYDVAYLQTRAAFVELEPLLPPDGDFHRWGRAVQRAEGPRDLPPEAYPMLVSFADLTDPASVFEVDPADLSAAFGAGYALERITLEITDEEVTEGVVEAVLGWLRDVAPNRLDGSRYEYLYAENRFANSLSPFSFSTGLNK